MAAKGVFKNLLLAVAAFLLAYWLYYQRKIKKTLNPQKKIPLKLMKKIVLNWNTVRYVFQLPTSRHILGLPTGQHVFLSATMPNPRTGLDKKYIARPYTPVSNDDDVGVVEFVIKTYHKDKHPKFPDGGWMSQHMDRMKIGDTLDFRGPVGKVQYKGGGMFTVKGKEKHFKKVGLIMGGVGITPGYQLMKYADQQKDPLDISLLFANVSTEDILIKEELDALAKKGYKIRYTVDKVKDGESWNGYVGYVNAQMVQETMPAPGPDTGIFVCGPPVMLEKCVMPILSKFGYTVIEY